MSRSGPLDHAMNWKIGAKSDFKQVTSMFRLTLTKEAERLAAEDQSEEVTKDHVREAAERLLR